MQVSEIMNREVITLPSLGTVRDAQALITRHRIHDLPIVDCEQLVGVISCRDIDTAEFAGSSHSLPWFKEMPITWVASCPVAVLPPAASVDEAVKLMVELKVGCVPIVEGARLVGIITAKDLMRLVDSETSVSAHAEQLRKAADQYWEDGDP